MMQSIKWQGSLIETVEAIEANGKGVSSWSDSRLLDLACVAETKGAKQAIQIIEAEIALRGLRSEVVDLTCSGWFECDILPACNEVDAMAEPNTVPDVSWTEAVTFVSNVEEMPHKQYRIVMFIAGHDVEGPWSDYQAAVFKVEALRLARAGVGFSVEFK